MGTITLSYDSENYANDKGRPRGRGITSLPPFSYRRSGAALAVAVALVAHLVALAIAILLLLELPLHLLLLKLLIGPVAILLGIEIALLLALLDGPVEIALALFGLRPPRRCGRQNTGGQNGGSQNASKSKTGAAVCHGFNVARHRGISKAEKSKRIEQDDGTKKKRLRLGSRFPSIKLARREA